LIIKGRFSQKQIENVLRRYISKLIWTLKRKGILLAKNYSILFSEEYVTCHTCRSPDTNLVKEERIFFLQCDKCGSKCAVASIKSGFQAQVVKRAVQRAKAT
jgi:translation initiation factor 2 subunit 2